MLTVGVEKNGFLIFEIIRKIKPFLQYGTNINSRPDEL